MVEMRIRPKAEVMSRPHGIVSSPRCFNVIAKLFSFQGAILTLNLCIYYTLNFEKFQIFIYTVSRRDSPPHLHLDEI